MIPITEIAIIQGRELHGGVGQDGQAEADETIGAHLEEHPGQDDRTGRRSFDVGVRKPGMEGEQRNLDGEADEHGQEDPVLEIGRDAQFLEGQNVEGPDSLDGVLMEVEGQDSQQEQDRAQQRVEEELDGRVQFPGPAPDADDEVHGHQHDFPEDVEEEEVQSHEYAQHPRLQNQEVAVVLAHPGGDGVPRRENGDGSEQSGSEGSTAG